MAGRRSLRADQYLRGLAADTGLQRDVGLLKGTPPTVVDRSRYQWYQDIWPTAGQPYSSTVTDVKVVPHMDRASQGPETYRLPESLPEDIEKVRQAAAQFAAGDLTEAQWKAVCGPMGICEQRTAGTYMIRLRLPAGVVLPHQMRALADVSARYANGTLHFTTRQNIQVHGVPLAALPEALLALQAAGLASKGAGGNAVRNIATCPEAGVCANETFDVAPYAVALTEFLLPDPLSYQMPRKYKIACSGCGRDCAGATLADLGLIATERDGVPGFVAYVAGGLGAHSAVGQLLEPFVPAADVFLVAEAIKRVFNQRGNRENRAHARIRFLVEDLGFARFKELYLAELTQLRQESPAVPALRPSPHLAQQPGGGEAGDLTSDAGFQAWRARAVSSQAQSGHNLVALPLFLGDIEAKTFHALADLVAQVGDGVLRTNFTQNARLRWVTDAQLRGLYQRLAALGLTTSEPALLQNLVSCAGASTCRPGLCLSRGLAQAIAENLRASELDLDSLGELKIRISGCHNSCGRDETADIGFAGAVRRVDGHPAPHYTVLLGGRVQAGETRLGEAVGTLPARNVPSFLRDLLGAFAASPQFPDFEAFRKAAEGTVAGLIDLYAALPAFEEERDYYRDWGAEGLFLAQA